MKILLRVKTEGMGVLELDPDKISGYCIAQENTTHDHQYVLVAQEGAVGHILNTGNFDSCHHMLNKIHNLLDVHVVDVN